MGGSSGPRRFPWGRHGNISLYRRVGCRRERKVSSDVSQRVRFFPRVMVAVAVQEASWPPMHFGVPHKQGLYTRESGQC